MKFERDLVQKCIFCNSSLNFGLKTGISLSCSHKICFECKLSSYLLECPIDKKMIDSNNKYIITNPSSIVPNCHNFHSFYNRSSEIYHLNCMHYSCDSCLEFKHCSTAWTLVKKLNNFPAFKNNCRYFLNLKTRFHSKI